MSEVDQLTVHPLRVTHEGAANPRLHDEVYPQVDSLAVTIWDALGILIV